MRDPTRFGSGCTDWQALDGKQWWIRDTVFTEPNGDYTAGCWLALYAGITSATVEA